MTNNSQPNYAQIRRLLNTTFDDSGLDAFCQDYFLPVYDRFSRGMRKDEKITLLLDHCRRTTNGFEALSQAAYSAYEMSEFQRDELRDLAGEIASLLEEQSTAVSARVIATQTAVQSSGFKQIKLRTLEERLQTLIKQYEAANQQMSSTLAATDKVTIGQQIKNLEQEIQDVEDEINQLKKST